MAPSDFASILSSQLKSLFPNATDRTIQHFVQVATQGMYCAPSDSEFQEILERFQLHMSLEQEIEEKPLVRVNHGDFNPAPKQAKPTSNSSDTQMMSDELPGPNAEYFESDKAFPIETDYIEQRTVSILEVLHSTFQKEEHFKQMCNKIYKGIKAYVQDPLNPLNAMVPLLFDDLEQNEDIFMQLATLCTEFGILIDTREKGVFLVFKVPEYVSCRAEYYQMLEKLLKSFQSHKDESVLAKASSLEQKQKTNHMDVNRQERVEAFFDAKRRRAAVASQYPMYWTGEGIQPEHPQPAPANALASMPHRYEDYPEEPSEHVPEEGIPLMGRTLIPKPQMNMMSPVNPAPFVPNNPNDVRAHIRQNYDALEKRLQQGNRVKIDKSAAQKVLDKDSYLAQIQEYRNRVRNNNHQMIQKRDQPKGMTWGELEQKADFERQEQLGRECLKHTNEFRQKHNLPPLKWEPLMFDIGRIG